MWCQKYIKELLEDAHDTARSNPTYPQWCVWLFDKLLDFKASMLVFLIWNCFWAYSLDIPNIYQLIIGVSTVAATIAALSTKSVLKQNQSLEIANISLIQWWMVSLICFSAALGWIPSVTAFLALLWLPLFLYLPTSMNKTLIQTCIVGILPTVCFLYRSSISNYDIFILGQLLLSSLFLKGLCSTLTQLIFLKTSSLAETLPIKQQNIVFDQLIQNLTHSLNNFIMSVDFISFRALSTDNKSKNHTDDWNSVQKCILELNEVMRDVQLVRIINSKNEELHLEVLSTTEVYNDLRDKTQRILSEKNIHLDSNIKQASFIWSNSDILVTNVLGTLLKRSLERSSAGETHFFGCYVQKHHTLLTIGPQLTNGQIDSYFKKINQGEATKDSQQGGSVLQLSIVQFFMQKMGGNFFLFQHKDLGSKYTYIIVLHSVTPITLKQLYKVSA